MAIARLLSLLGISQHRIKEIKGGYICETTHCSSKAKTQQIQLATPFIRMAIALGVTFLRRSA